MRKKSFMIKIYAFFSLFCLTAIFVEAQFEPGQKVAGGNLGFSTGKSKYLYGNSSTTDYSNVSISPSIGSFRKPNLLYGMGLAYGYNYQKTTNLLNTEVNRTSNHSIGINLFSQRFFTLAQNFFFTINTGVSVGYTFGKQINTTNNFGSEAKSSGYGASANFAPGLTYRFTRRLLFDAYLRNLINISYSHNQIKDKNASAPLNKSVQNNFSLSSGLSNTSLGNVGLGFRWSLRR